MEIKKPKPVLIIIGGPTGSGKTSLAISLARHFKTEILNADSRQFYREMAIGTAKPTPDELQAATHHFVNNLSIVDAYSVGDFEKDALQLLGEKFRKNNIMIMTGGSGLYLRAVYEGLDEFPEVPLSIREDWENKLKDHGLSFLQSALEAVDPDYFQEVDLQNPARLIRALSVSTASGKPYSSFRNQKSKSRPFETLLIYLEWPRELLYQRINERVDLMLAGGLLDEVRKLVPYRHLPALQAVGYTELFEYLDGDISYEEAVEKIKMNSRRYAKRQGTWFRKYGKWKTFPGDSPEKVLSWVETRLQEMQISY